MIDTISLSKFLSRYCNVKGDSLKKITHEEVKVLFPELSRAKDKALRTKNEILSYIKSNKEDLLYGRILLVSDGHYIIPYFTPVLSTELEDEMQVERHAEPGIKVDDEHYDYSKLNEYELRQLLRRKFSSPRNQTCARRELHDRGISITKKYRRNDYKIKLEEE